MDEAQRASSSPDDTAAFQRFYSESGAPASNSQSRSLLYRVLIGWWRDRL